MKRFGLFLLTNIAVLVVISVIFSVFGIGNVLDERGVDLDLGALLVYSAVIGFVGSLISLAISKPMAKWQTGAKVIEDARDEKSQWLVSRVRAHSEAAGIGMPEVAIFDAEAPNAFATGMRRNSALVAVSSGLLRTMRRNEIDAVIGHEIARVANGDMITLTLIQGVVNFEPMKAGRSTPDARTWLRRWKHSKAAQRPFPTAWPLSELGEVEWQRFSRRIHRSTIALPRSGPTSVESG